MESIEQTFNGAAGFGKRVTCQISRNGDLIHKVYLQVELPAGGGATYVDWVGLRLIKNVEIEIGGQRIKYCRCGKAFSLSQMYKNRGKTVSGVHHRVISKRKKK